MFTKQELLLEEVNGRWQVALHNHRFISIEGNDDEKQDNRLKIKALSQLSTILDSNDDLSFHYKNPSDYNLLITIVEELDSELKERILQKIECERDGKKFTKDALEYLRKQFEEMNDIKKRGERYLGVHPQTLVVIVYIRDHDDVNETEEDILYRIEQALRKHDYDPEELLKDEEDVLKLYNEVK